LPIATVPSRSDATDDDASGEDPRGTWASVRSCSFCATVLSTAASANTSPRVTVWRGAPS
jgi:hypothetical protein